MTTYHTYIKRSDRAGVSITDFADFTQSTDGWQALRPSATADKPEDALQAVMPYVLNTIFARGYTDDDVDIESSIHNRTAAVVSLTIFDYDLQRSFHLSVGVHV